MIKTIVKFRTKKFSANLSPALNILLKTRHVMHKDDLKQHSKKEQIQKYISLNPLNTKFTKWSNTLKQSVGKLPTNCLSVFDYFVGLAFKGLRIKF